MDKKLVMRRVAILLALVVGVIQMQLGGAVTATTYDFAASNQTLRSDALGGGSASTSGAAEKVSGTFSATANATSSSQLGAGSYNFSGRGIGGNLAKRDSFIRETFALTAGLHTITVSVDISSLSTPSLAASPGIVDEADYTIGAGPCAVDPQLPCTGIYPRITNSKAYSLVQLGASAFSTTPNESGCSTTCSYNATATFKSSDGNAFNEISTGVNTLTYSIVVPAGGGNVVVEVHLVAEAWAAGDGSSAAAGAVGRVTQIDVT